MEVSRDGSQWGRNASLWSLSKLALLYLFVHIISVKSELGNCVLRLCWIMLELLNSIYYKTLCYNSKRIYIIIRLCVSNDDNDGVCIHESWALYGSVKHRSFMVDKVSSQSVERAGYF